VAVAEVRLAVGLVADLLVAARLVVGLVADPMFADRVAVVAEACLVGMVRLVGTVVERELSDNLLCLLQH
jgi:hypothetical protein